MAKEKKKKEPKANVELDTQITLPREEEEKQ
jgi:hypothetical protein